MNKEIAMKWAAALESGEYSQTKSMLHTDGGFCCLGVLCEISGLGNWEAPDEYHDGDGYYYMSEHHGEWEILPENVKAWAGMKETDGWLNDDPFNSDSRLGTSLATLNDAGHSFEEIASVIKNNWKVL